MELERRCVDGELRVEGDTEPRLSGYAAVFNRSSVDLGGFTEEIAPGAFSTTIREDDVVALVDHESSRILGRVSAKTLDLREDDTGLMMSVAVPNTTVGRDIVESVRRGDVKGQSFSFRTIEDEWQTRDGQPHRILKQARLYDVGPVTFPAYPDTSIAARSLQAWKDSQIDQTEEVNKINALRQELSEWGSD